MNDFDAAHAAFVQYHKERRSGERLGRLERGHGHAEILFLKQVWWPLKGQFDDLHPEYEVLDWRNRSYFADFVYASNLWNVLIEIKGFDAHVRNMDRQKYCNELNRETFLSGMGYHVISFAYDDVAHQPKLCMYLLRTVLSRYEAGGNQQHSASLVDREILKYAVQLARPIRPVDVSRNFSMDHRTAVKHLRRLCGNGWLKPVHRGTGQRVLYYEITKQGIDSIML